MHTATVLLTAFALLAPHAQAAECERIYFDATTKPGLSEKVQAGSTYSVEWIVNSTCPTGPVSIYVVAGEKQGELSVVGSALATHYDNDLGKFSWKVDSSLGSASIYGIRIDLEANSTGYYQFTPPFQIVGGSSSSSSSASSSASSTTSTSATTGSSTSASTTQTTISVPTGTGTSATTTPITTASTTSSASTTSTTTRATNAAAPTGAGVVGALGAFGLAALLI